MKNGGTVLCIPVLSILFPQLLSPSSTQTHRVNHSGTSLHPTPADSLSLSLSIRLFLSSFFSSINLLLSSILLSLTLSLSLSLSHTLNTLPTNLCLEPFRISPLEFFRLFFFPSAVPTSSFSFFLLVSCLSASLSVRLLQNKQYGSRTVFTVLVRGSPR